MTYLHKRLLVSVLAGGLALALAVVSVWMLPAGQHSAHAGVLEATVGIDTDTTGNTATTLGALDTCTSVENTPAGTFDIDVFLDGIPIGEDLAGFNYQIVWDDTRFKITAQDHALLLDAAAGSSILDFGSEAVPDTVSPHDVGPADLGAPPGSLEFGPMVGVLGRYTLEILPGAAAGLANFSLINVGVFNSTGGEFQDQVLDATIALGVGCPQPADVKLLTQDVSFPSEITAGEATEMAIDKVIHNNGPANVVDIEITKTVTVPADCTVNGESGPAVEIVDILPDVPMSQEVPFQELDDIECSQPSDHQITVENCLQPVDLPDPDPSNDCQTDIVNFTVIADADLKVIDVSISGPASAGVGEQFEVTASVTVHNNGPFEPVDALVDSLLSLPGDCAIVQENPQTISVNALPASVPTVVDVTWDVTCNNESFHNFDADGIIRVNQLHVLDGDDTNDSGVTASSATVPIIAEADLDKTLEVFGRDGDDCSLPLPDEIPVDTEVELCLVSTIHNNGPADTLFDDTVDLVSAPGDCEVSAAKGGFPFGSIGTPIAADIDVIFEDHITINCSQPSFHTFEFEDSVEISVEEIHVVDSDPSNNSDTATAIIGVTADADLKVLDVVVDAPASVTAGVPFDVTVDANVHNNGPFGPFDATATVTLDADDCTVSGDSQVTEDLTGLQVSVAVPITQQTFSVTCSTAGAKTFSATVDAAAEHIDDGSGDGSDTTTVVAPTPTPTPTPVVAAATATPTATPVPAALGAAALPATGSEPSDGGGIASWIFIALGGGLLALAIVGGVARTRLARRHIR